MNGTHTDLGREDLDGDVFTEQLSLPHAAKAPPGFQLQQLQRILSQDGGGGQGAGLLGETGGDQRQRIQENKEHLVRAVGPHPHGHVYIKNTE